MKNTAIVFLTVCALAVTAGCKKSKGGCAETAIQATTTPANGSSEVPGPGPDFPLEVNITAGLPPAGVTIEVLAKPESPSNASPFYTISRVTSSNGNSFTIAGTPVSTNCVVTVTITSKSCNSNKWTGSYRYARK